MNEVNIKLDSHNDPLVVLNGQEISNIRSIRVGQFCGNPGVVEIELYAEIDVSCVADMDIRLEGNPELETVTELASCLSSLNKLRSIMGGTPTEKRADAINEISSDVISAIDSVEAIAKRNKPLVKAHST